MNAARALDINSRLCKAYLVQEGIQAGPMPSLADVSLDEALEASRIIDEAGGRLNSDGSTTFICHVAERAIRRVYAGVVLAHS